MANRTTGRESSRLPDAEIPPYRCLKVALTEGTIYFRHYADYWLRAQQTAAGGWNETVVAPETVEMVCGHYPYRTGPLSDYPL
jgi:hypothetical protein